LVKYGGTPPAREEFLLAENKTEDSHLGILCKCKPDKV